MSINNLHYYRPVPHMPQPPVHSAELVIYGATAAGVIAAVQAARLGLKTILLEFGSHIGGVTSSGLGATDIGNKSALGGLTREFYQLIGAHYGEVEKWNFEPHVAEAAYQHLLRDAGVQVHFQQHLSAVRLECLRITGIEMECGTTYLAPMFMDCTYEGDLMAMAGVTYTVGREANATYGETLNGVHFGHKNHNFTVPVDPFVVPGDPSSGFLHGISTLAARATGSGDLAVQAYNFRLCLTDAADRIPFPKPAHYDPARFELLRRSIDAGVFDALRLSKRMPGGKTDTNNHGGFSTDYIGANHGWPDGDYALREVIFQDHVHYTQGLLWFLANDPRLPAEIRERVSRWGLPHDEFHATGGFPHQLYVREARRMVADTVITEAHAFGTQTCELPVALATYQIDSHSCHRLVVNGRLTNEGCVEVSVPGPFPLPYRALVPRAGECENLFVPVCLSATHTAYGSIRMEPVFMALAQSAALAAHLALQLRVPVQAVPAAALEQSLAAAGQVTRWVPPKEEPAHAWPARVEI